MDRINAIETFIAVAETGGFAAAARRLQTSPPSVTRTIAALEQHLGARLFQRTTRSVRTTDAGDRFLHDARRLITELEAAEASVRGLTQQPRGHLAVTAPVMFGAHYVMPCITEYLQRYPLTNVSALFLDRSVDLVEEGVDVGVRIAHLPDSSLRAIPVGEVRHVVCATLDYLERHGEPNTPQSLSEHTLIDTTQSSFSPGWQFQRHGKTMGLKVNPRLRVTTTDGALAAAEKGLGIVRLLSYQVHDALNAGRLRQLLNEYAPPALPIHIVHREEGQGAKKVRAFIDQIVSTLRSDQTLHPMVLP